MTKVDIQKKALIDALEKSLGVVSTACEKADISRTTFYNYYNEDELFKSEVDAIAELAIDFAETQLHKRIKEGSDTAIIFYLKTKGKKRGYIEKSEIEHSGSIKTTKDLTDEELARIASNQ